MLGRVPGCEPYQGRVFARGNHPKYPDFYTETTYGEPDGIFGINCHHVSYAFVEGVSTKRYKRYDKERNDTAYENSQIQRKYERTIRNSKTEKAMLERIGDTEGVKQAEQKIRNQQANLRRLTNETGRTRRYDREQVYN